MGLTLADACERIAEHGVKISVGGLANIETGARPASNHLLVAWAKAFGIHPLDVCKGTVREGPVIAEPDTEPAEAAS
jgi:predicted homoserine dehydrogenase-like protein